GNRFTGWTQHAIAVVDGTLGEIAYNELYEHADWGAVTASNFQMRIAIRTAGNEGTTPPQFQEDVWVHHNYFHDFPTKPDPNRYSSGQNDAIEMCQASSRAWEA